jgi:hypothetical protein
MAWGAHGTDPVHINSIANNGQISEKNDESVFIFDPNRCAHEPGV